MEKKINNNNNLREVGPSRKILHARGVGSERRKSVTRVAGSWGALGATRKIFVFSGRLVFWPLQGPLFLGSRMRRTIYDFQFYGFRKNIFYALKHGNSYCNPSI